MSVRPNLNAVDPTNVVDLPKPPKKLGEHWLPAARISRHIPFGYEVDPEDDSILLPIVEELELLEKAKVYLREYSSRDVAHWLSENSGRKISHVGLLKRVKQEKYRRSAAGAYRKYARLYKKAAEAAKKLDKKIGGGELRTPVLKGKADKLKEQREYDREIARQHQDT